MSSAYHQRHVLLLENIHPNAQQLLESNGLQVERLTTSLTHEELCAKLLHWPVRYDYVGIRSKTQIRNALLRELAEADRLPMAIACFCIGTDQVDVDVATALGVQVYNAPFANTRSVAELVLSHLIALHRRVADCTREIHEHGTWNKSATGCHEVRGRTLGIVGYGNVGTQLSILAEAIGLNVLFFDVVPKLPYGNAQQVDSLDELLERSDVVSIHVPLLASTNNLFDAHRIGRMKRGAYLINTSRGNVVNLEALAEAVRNGRLGGCAVDVYPDEPHRNGAGLFEHCPLRGLPNTILTPHIGGSTEEAQEAIAVEVASHLVLHHNKESNV